METMYVIFQLNELCCALPCREVKEVLPNAEPFVPPALPSFVSGFLNLGGAAVPVLPPEALLGLPAAPSRAADPHSHLLLVHHRSGPFALHVERVLEVLTLPPDAFLPVGAPHTFNHCVTGQTRHGDRIIYLLDSNQLLLQEEQARLQEFQARAQSRLQQLADLPS